MNEILPPVTEACDAVNVLCVEANASHASLIRHACLCSNKKIELCFVASLTEAAPLLEETAFELVLVTAGPEMGDLDWIGELKEKMGLVPLVILSSDPDERKAVEAVRLGADDYLIKSRKTLEALPKTLWQIVRRSGRRIVDDAQQEKGVNVLTRNLKIISNLISQPARNFYRDGTLPNLAMLEKEIDSIKSVIKNLMVNK